MILLEMRGLLDASHIYTFLSGVIAFHLSTASFFSWKKEKGLGGEKQWLSDNFLCFNFQFGKFQLRTFCIWKISVSLESAKL